MNQLKIKKYCLNILTIFCVLNIEYEVHIHKKNIFCIKKITIIAFLYHKIK